MKRYGLILRCVAAALFGFTTSAMINGLGGDFWDSVTVFFTGWVWVVATSNTMEAA